MLVQGTAWCLSPAEELAAGGMQAQKPFWGTRATKGDKGQCSAATCQGNLKSILLSHYYVPWPVLGAEDCMMNGRHSPALRAHTAWGCLWACIPTARHLHGGESYRSRVRGEGPSSTDRRTCPPGPGPGCSHLQRSLEKQNIKGQFSSPRGASGKDG